MLLATFSLSDYQGWGIPLSSEMGIRCELDWVLHLLRGAQMQEQLSKVFSCFNWFGNQGRHVMIG